MSHDSKETYIGDGVYASLDPGRMIVLRTRRLDSLESGGVHWIGLEPEVLTELLHFAFQIGWGDLILNIANKQRAQLLQTDEKYARDEEDEQRKRDAAEGFDE